MENQFGPRTTMLLVFLALIIWIILISTLFTMTIESFLEQFTRLGKANFLNLKSESKQKGQLLRMKTSQRDVLCVLEMSKFCVLFNAFLETKTAEY